MTRPPTKRELVEALRSLVELHAADDEGQPMLRWYGASEVAIRVDRARKLLDAAKVVLSFDLKSK
jgi:HrpA-like RNA helicase